MTEQEKLNRQAFKRRMVASGRLPITEDYLVNEELTRQRTIGAYSCRPEGYTAEEWSAALGKREAFREQMRASGRLPKESEAQKKATTLLLNESRMIEEMKQKGVATEEQRKQLEELEAKLNALEGKLNNNNINE